MVYQSSSSSSSFKMNNLPPGFRFHPTDEELIICYLKNQATSRPCPASIIPEVDIYKFDPWQLPAIYRYAEKAEIGDGNEWYFFTPRDRKYPNGARPNRATVSGYWKATGTDKAIHSGSQYAGVKKSLVFYKGRPPKGVKTDWIMHEYRLIDSNNNNYQPKKQSGSMRLDDWVLCRIYKKKQTVREILHDPKMEEESLVDTQMETKGTSNLGFIGQHDAIDDQEMLKFPRTISSSNFLADLENNVGPISMQLLFSENEYNHSGF